MGPEAALDPYFKKRVALVDGGERLEFEVAHTLFASHQVDSGTKLLLRCLETEPPPPRILDLGCGYGAWGSRSRGAFPRRGW